MSVSNALASLGAELTGARFGSLWIFDDERRWRRCDYPLVLAASTVKQLARSRTGDDVLVTDEANLETARTSGLMGHEADEYIDDPIVGDAKIRQCNGVMSGSKTEPHVA